MFFQLQNGNSNPLAVAALTVAQATRQPDADIVIKVEHLTKAYAGHPAVDDISFAVDRGEVVGFLGPNGAGKSTTIKVLTGAHSATSGTVRINGMDVVRHPESVKAAIGYLPENVPLYPELRVGEYLAYRCGIKGMSRRKRHQQVGQVLERCRLTNVESRIIGQLSKGFRQRVGIADALLGDPPLLILDEPTVGLDPNQVRDVRALISELGTHRTVIVSSHVLQEVEAICGRVIIINDGKIVAQGDTRSIQQQLAGKAQRVDVEVIDPQERAKPVLTELMGVEAIERIADEQRSSISRYRLTTTADVREAIFDAAVGHGFKIVELHRHTHSLEDAFVALTHTDEKSPPSEETS